MLARRLTFLLTRIAGIAALAGLAGCASDPPTDPGYHLVSTANAKGLPSLNVYMEAAGCTVAARGGPGVIGILHQTGKSDRFDCHAVSSAKARQAIHAYRVAVRSALRGAALTENDGYYALTFEYSSVLCGEYQYVGTRSEYTGINSVGQMTYLVIDFYQQTNCTEEDYWFAEWVPDGDGGSGGDGQGPPYAPPTQLDSVPEPPQWTDDMNCNPFVPGCLVTLNSKQMKFLTKALDYIDTTTYKICASAVRVERQLLANGKVYYGAVGPDSVPGYPVVPPHTGLTVLQTDANGHNVHGPDGNPIVTNQHIDQTVLKNAMDNGDDDSRARMGLGLVHEGLHALGYTHPGETGAPYQTYPFSLADPPVNPIVGTCVKPGYVLY